MKLQRHPDAAHYLAAAQAFLSARPVARGIPLSVAHQLVVEPERYQRPYWMATVRGAGGEVLCAGLRTPPFRALVTDGPSEAAALLARDALALYGDSIVGVLGPENNARAFADACDAVVPPRPCAGAMRQPEDPEIGTLEAWTDAFFEDAGVPSHEPAAKQLARIRERGDLWMWDDEGPVSMLAAFPQDSARRSVRLALVYTPPGLRGRGYASNAVAALSRRLLDEGSAVGLATDLANPTSNHIYRALGYRPVFDLLELMLRRAAPRSR